MTSKLLPLLALSLLACEAEEVPPPRTPARSTHASVAAVPKPPTEEEIREQALAIRADQITEERAQRAKMNAQIAAGNAAIDAQIAEGKRLNAAAEQKTCSETRAARVAKAKELATAAKKWWSAVSKNRAWIDAKCKFTDTTGTHVTAVKEGGGVTVRTRRVGRIDAVACSASRPAGLTEDDVRDYLNDQATTSLDSLFEEQHACREHDRAEGVDLSVTLSDTSGLERVLALP